MEFILNFRDFTCWRVRGRHNTQCVPIRAGINQSTSERGYSHNDNVCAVVCCVVLCPSAPSGDGGAYPALHPHPTTTAHPRA